MKSRIHQIIGMLCVAWFSQIVINAQQTEARVNLLEFGLVVSFGTEMKSAEKTILKGAFDTYIFLRKNDLIHRVLIDENSGIYFGYDFEIKPNASNDKFRISIKPLSLKPDERYKFNRYSGNKLPKYPASVVLKIGERLELELLENPQTKARIVDLIKVSKIGSITRKTKATQENK